ncbi:MAG: Holliday junction resolvase RuvX [Deltaproteobacteria bacterium]|nr:Holliday junction resolvase RuvX [Deltaproteobacteria bacterium]
MNQKIICIDYGLKRIGVALSDDRGTIAFPHKYIINENFNDAATELKNIIITENASLIVVGMPIGLSGKQSSLSIEVIKFIDELKKIIEDLPIKNLPIITYDERFSTAQAQRSLIDRNVKRKKRKQTIDSIAASFILQSYLDGINSTNNNT